MSAKTSKSLFKHISQALNIKISDSQLFLACGTVKMFFKSFKGFDRFQKESKLSKKASRILEKKLIMCHNAQVEKHCSTSPQFLRKTEIQAIMSVFQLFMTKNCLKNSLDY
jgi:hypothetical protein